MTAATGTASSASRQVRGAGLGFRRGLMAALESVSSDAIDFMEIAPENWMGVGGRLGRRFRAFTERFPFIAHGLSLSIGSPEPLDETFLVRLRRFLDEHGIHSYSEHLSYSSDDGHLYDLMPMPFTEAAVRHCAARIRQVQDVLGRRIAMENISYYTTLPGEMREHEFIVAVLEAADCDLLLDVNNIHVNSVNHGYDAMAFLEAMPVDRVVQYHIAGHLVEAEDLIVDTHGSDIVEPVYALLDAACHRFGVKPTLLERDFNYPPMPVLLAELSRIRSVQARHAEHDERRVHADVA